MSTTKGSEIDFEYVDSNDFKIIKSRDFLK